jgi:hypothetical protein
MTKISDKPSSTSSAEKVNELTDLQIKYQSASASSDDKVLIIAESQLKQPEVNDIQKFR